MHDEHDKPLTEHDLNLLEEMGYERSDLDPTKAGGGRKAAWGVFIFFFVFVVLSIATIQLTAPDLIGVPKEETLARRRMPEAPAPLLQDNITSHTDTWNLRAEEAKKLNKYGWANEQQTAATVPVEEAMKVVGERGMPRWSARYDAAPQEEVRPNSIQDVRTTETEETTAPGNNRPARENTDMPTGTSTAGAPVTTP